MNGKAELAERAILCFVLLVVVQVLPEWSQASEVTLIQATTHSANDTHPSWSPDGKKIAFTSGRGGNVDIWVMSMDETKVNLTKDSAVDINPVWSPDGRKIAFESNRAGGGRNRDIYVMDDDGRNVKRLTNPENSGPSDQRGTMPAWSPDGNKIAFEYNMFEIWVMDSDGSHQKRLVPGTRQRIAREPQWSPDGKYIYFCSHEPPKSRFPEIWRSRVDKTEDREQITKVGCVHRCFRFNPADPGKVALALNMEAASGRRGNWEIYIMNADGSNRQNVSNHVYTDIGCAWSPDGTRIAFSSDRSGNYDIWVAVLSKAGTSASEPAPTGKPAPE